MSEPVHKKSGQSVALAVGILLTCLAMAAHRFLPERRLTLDTSRGGDFTFIMQTGVGLPAEMKWIDQSHSHFSCQFQQEVVHEGCGYGAYLLSATEMSQGLDLSRFRTMNLVIRYTGKAQYLRVAIRNFDPKFSRIEDGNSLKYNYVNIPTRDLGQPVPIGMREFMVAEWWVREYDLPRAYSQPDLGNATVFNMDLQGDLAGSYHDIRVDKIEFVGDWISAESWYMGILCLWMILAATYGTSQWLLLRRRHRAQRKKIEDLETEKEKYQKLSTIDALTRVLNRHGIDHFIAALRITRVPASVIVVDLDNFKRVNDQRGHHVGDRVLRVTGEILRTGTRNTDGLGRWGGEEFVLVCPGASLARAVDLAEKLRHKIMETDFIPEDPLRITASFGVASTGADQSFEDAFRQADEALYLAKSRGRNCVVCANEDRMQKVTGTRKGALAAITGRFKLHR